MASIEIQRMPLETSPTARLNAYNRHALAPWLAETGYLTPLYLYRREQERLPYNMGRWLTDKISQHMLYPPSTVLKLDIRVIEQLLRIAARCDYSPDLVKHHTAEIEQIGSSFPALPPTDTGYFIRLSESSPKDVDDGNLHPVHSISQALQKLICSKRATQALLALHEEGPATTDNQLYFFPYHTSLDHLSEWRCYIHKNKLVAISQSRFYQVHHAGVADSALRRMAKDVEDLWSQISNEVAFDSCTLDIYAQVHRPGFKTKLIEINPYFAHVGSGSLLFHWIDDADILLSIPDPKPNPSQGKDKDEGKDKIVIRLVDPPPQSKNRWSTDTSSTPLGRKEAYLIGRAGIIQDEVDVLEERGLTWILDEQRHEVFMRMGVPGRKGEGEKGMGCVTRKGRLERFREEFGGGKAAEGRIGEEMEKVEVGVVEHPRLRKVREAWRVRQEQKVENQER